VQPGNATSAVARCDAAHSGDILDKRNKIDQLNMFAHNAFGSLPDAEQFLTRAISNRDQQPAPGRELRQQRRGHIGCSGRYQNGIVGAVFRPAIAAITEFQTEITATLMENPVSGTGAIILGKNYVKIPKMNLRLGGGKGSLSTQVYFKGNKKEGNFDVGFEGINLKVFNPYFPKGIGAVTGTLFGKFKGDFLQGERDVVISNGIFDLKALDGAVKEFNMEKHIIKVISAVAFLYATKKVPPRSLPKQPLELPGHTLTRLLNL
jgi:hypothetical protein